MQRSGALLFVGNLFFSRFVPHLRHRGLSSVLVATCGTDGELEADHVVRALPDIAADEMVSLALEYGVCGVVTKALASHEHTIVRDAVAKEILERKHGIPTFAPSLRAAMVSADKGYTRQLLTSHGILMPRGAVVATLAELEEAVGGLHFPVVLKVPDGSFSRALVFVEARRDLPSAYRRLGASRVVVEEFVSGEEVSVEVLTWEGGTAVQPATYLGETNPDVNPHGKVRICPYFSAEVQDQLSGIVLQIAELLQAQGILQVDLVYEGEQFYVLEVNSRFGGTSDLSSLASGESVFEQAIQMVTGCWKPSRPALHTVCIEVPALLSDSTAALLEVPGSPLRYLRGEKGGVGVATLASSRQDCLLDYIEAKLSLPVTGLMTKVQSALERSSRLIHASR